MLMHGLQPCADATHASYTETKPVAAGWQGYGPLPIMIMMSSSGGLSIGRVQDHEDFSGTRPAMTPD